MGPSVIPHLLDAVGTTISDRDLADVLRFYGDRGVVALIVALEEADDAERRLQLLVVLRYLEEDARTAIPVVRDLTNDEDELVRKYAATVLEAIETAVARTDAPHPPVEQPPVRPGIPAWARVSDEQIQVAKDARIPVAFANDLGMRFVLIPDGSFVMGSPEGEEGRYWDEPQHRVTISRPYYMQVFETTNAQFRRFHADHDSRAHKGHSLDGDEQPVVRVSWEDAKAFAAWLTERSGERTYRLPTEAEWEHACRAGTETPFWWGRQITSSWANYDGLYEYDDGPVGIFRACTVDVGSFAANPWGLHDVHGNVAEWCLDGYWEYAYLDRGDDPIGMQHVGTRVVRGGCWKHGPILCRSAHRSLARRSSTGDTVGFRLVVPVR
jgi:formylglycine-generating enzyme required for sulfatase activity